MYLKSVKLTGFKSFADRTRLELRPGVTVIVGPNGSGKSNIVDAVAWVMGSQAPKSLRTQKMEDVIFAGTATRPGLGRAEVTLILDNSSRMLPLDLAEVSISRRLYRDGSSDYEINGVGCRLLDIQELLSDSGVGRHQHVVIGQGQIDSILNATGDEHRAVIEEAAGILKHRLRKERAIRRLERTGADVVRLHDLIGEMVRQMRPLKRQRDAAARYQGIVDEVKALRLYLGGSELRQAASRRNQVVKEEEDLRAKVAETEAACAELAAVSAILRREAGAVGEELDRDTSAAARIETTIEQLRRIGQVADERHRSGKARVEGVEERRGDLEAEMTQLDADLEEAAGVELRARRDAQEAESRFRDLEDEERSLNQTEEMSVEGAIAVVRGNLRALEAASDRDTRELASVTRRVEALSGQLEAERDTADRLNSEIKALDAAVATAQDSFTETQAVRTQAQELWEEAELAHSEARVRKAAASARLSAVEDAAAGMADPQARELVEAAGGAVGSIAQRLDVPAEMAAAVDVALGPWTDSIVFADRGSAGAAVTGLKSAGRGGVSLVDASPGRGASARAREVASLVGLKALIDLLGPQADTNLASLLVGDVVVAEGWHEAWRLSERFPEIRVVTPEGDLVTSNGMRVCNPDGATPAMVEAASAEVEAAETELARRASLLTQSKRAFDEARAAEREALEALESLEARMAGAIDSLGRARRTLATVDGEIEALAERRRALEAASATRAEQHGRLQERLSSLEGEEADRQRAWEELDHRRRQVSHEKEQARATWQEAVSAVRAAGERRTILATRLQVVEASLAADDEIPDPTTLARIESISRQARRALEVIRRHLLALRERQAGLRSRAGETGRRLGEVQASIDALTRDLATWRERLSQLAVEATELRVRAEAISERLRRDADASEEEALAAPCPEGDDLEALLTTREAELRRMGPVNPLAAAEYAELAQRHEFVSSQLEDLEKSRDELRKVVKALDTEIEARFLDAFEEVAAAYEKHFKVLFPGGTGSLRLAQPDEPLSSGVEIEAQPLGKKVSKMTLLSGGERSLAALAFLFAVFEARPSPFYILDEVEAALDDANLRRFLRLLEAFRDSAQLLIITHQQQTMEIADVLYGVTMEPGGSSRAVAKVLDEAILGAAR